MPITPPISPDADKNKIKVSKVPRRYLFILLLTLFIVSLLTIVSHYNIFYISKTVLMTFRWIAIAVGMLCIKGP